jgi:hypothetical protein
MTPIQLKLPFEDIPVTCPTQAKYHAIAPCLAGQVEPKQQAKLLNLSDIWGDHKPQYKSVIWKGIKCD